MTAPTPDPRSPHHDDDGDEVFDEFNAIEESDGAQHRRFILQREIKRRLDRYLTTRLPGLSRSKLQKLINEGAVTVNGAVPKSSTIVKHHDVIDVIVPPPPIKQIPPEPIPLQVLYEDDHLIVINKQADLVVHPARSNLTGTLVNGLSHYFKDIKDNGLEALSSVGVEEFRPGIVHRLDKDTTGAIVVAKTDESHWRLSRLFEQRRVQKYYLAITHGEMKPPGGVIDEPIGKHPQVTEAYAVRVRRLGPRLGHALPGARGVRRLHAGRTGTEDRADAPDSRTPDLAGLSDHQRHHLRRRTDRPGADRFAHPRLGITADAHLRPAES
jgi:RluA family pseudouridine synthase